MKLLPRRSLLECALHFHFRQFDAVVRGSISNSLESAMSFTFVTRQVMGDRVLILQLGRVSASSLFHLLHLVVYFFSISFFFLLFLFCLPSPLPQHRIIGLNNMKHEIDINIRNWTAAKQHSLHPPLSKADHYLSMTGVWFHSPHHFTNHESGWITHWIEACVEKRLTELNALPEMFLRGLRKYQPGRLHRACPVFMASIRTTVAVCIEAVNACNVWSKQPKQGRE